MMFDVNNIRIILALTMLSIASYTDVKKREIDDRIWIIFGSLSFVILFFTGNIFNSFLTVGISLIVAPVALIIWRFGFFGGADAFALIVLASLAPGSTFAEYQVNPFTTLTNAVIFSIIPVVINILRNIVALIRHEDIFEGFESETRKNKIFAMLIGHRSKHPKFSFSIETRLGKMKKMDFGMKDADSTEFCSSPDTWVTPGIPYLIYISAGFVTQLVFGDIIFNAIRMFH